MAPPSSNLGQNAEAALLTKCNSLLNIVLPKFKVTRSLKTIPNCFIIILGKGVINLDYFRLSSAHSKPFHKTEHNYSTIQSFLNRFNGSDALSLLTESWPLIIDWFDFSYSKTFLLPWVRTVNYQRMVHDSKIANYLPISCRAHYR